MDKLSPPPQLNLTGNLAENWRRFKQQYEIYEAASGTDQKDEKVRSMTFLHVVGSESLEIYNTFSWDEDGDKFKLTAICEKFEDYCNPRKNVTFERHVFFTRNQREGEKYDTYITDLRNKSSTCEFGTLCEGLIRDRIVCGIRSDSVRARLLRETDLTLQKCVDICRAAEASEAQLKELSDEKTVHSLNHAKSNTYQQQGARPKTTKGKNSKKTWKPSKPTSQQTRKQDCKYCGKIHQKGPKFCTAFGATCTKCQLKNHFAHMCMQDSRNVHTLDFSDSETETFFVGTVNTKAPGNASEWFVDAKINKSKVRFKIDSGAQCNVIPSTVCSKAGIKKLHRSKAKLVSYTGHSIKTIGKADISISVQGKYHVIPVQVVDSETVPVLGLQSSVDLGLIQRVYTAEKQPTLEDVKSKHANLFNGIGCLPGEHKIEVDETVPPVVQPPRRIPHTLKAKVKAELQRMMDMNIITKVEQPTKWVNPITIVRKPSGGVRICLDPRNLNKAIKREHYPLKTAEEVAASINGAKIFSKLDASSGFYQIKLAEESTWLTTFNTPFGRFKFERLPFGITSASEIFQRTLSQVLENMEGCDVIIDDILVWGEDLQEHNDRLEKVLTQCEKVDLRLNEQKCKFAETEVDYVGHIFGADGLKPNQDRIKSITDMAVPDDKKSLQRFLGMVNYFGKFIPNLSTLTHPLRELLEKDVAWHWTERHDTAISKLKEALTQAPVLKFFDVEANIKISVDASSYGLGACVLQNEQPVAYASRSLNTAERNYAQIEKEMLAIVFGLTKFHQYAYGKSVDVETDHKPLESLFKKPLSQAPQRIQRMMLKVQQYDLNVKYSPGETLHIADTLSRAPVHNVNDNKANVTEEFEVHLLVDVSHKKMAEIISRTDADLVLSKVKDIVINGWPKDRSQCDPEVLEYWNFRDELCICDGLLLKGDRIVIPASMRADTIDKLHESHLGIDKCISRAQQSVFWPGLRTQLQDKIAKCEVCNKHRNKQVKEPLKPHDVPDRPWQILASDLFYFNNDRYIVLVDYFSKFFEISKLVDGKSSTVIHSLKQQFSRHGIPEVLKSDNGPEYASDEFAKFMTSYGIEHVTSSPNYAQSNGLAERTIQTVKKLLKKAMDDNQDPYLAILELRNTAIPGVSDMSPVELLFGRKTRTRLPTRTSLLKPRYDNLKIKQQLQDKQQHMKNTYDKSAKPLPDLQKGDNVRMRSNDSKSWEPARFVCESKEPRSFIVQKNNKRYRRNRRDILKTSESPKIMLPTDQDHHSNVNVEYDYSKVHNEPVHDSSIVPVNDTSDSADTAVDQPTISRVSGRTIRKPSRFND